MVTTTTTTTTTEGVVYQDGAIPSLSSDEQKLVNELLYGTTTTKAKTINTDDDDHTTKKNKGTLIKKIGIVSKSTKIRQQQQQQTDNNVCEEDTYTIATAPTATIFSVQEEEEEEQTSHRDDDDGISYSSGTLTSLLNNNNHQCTKHNNNYVSNNNKVCDTNSVISGLTTKHHDDDDVDYDIGDEPSIVSLSTNNTNISTTGGKSNKTNYKHSNNIPEAYRKNKKLLTTAEYSRYQKYINELSLSNTKKLPKSSTIQKYLNHISLSLMKEGNNNNEQDKDTVTALNGIHIICHDILSEPKYIKQSKIVSLALSILSYLAKGNHNETRQIIIHDEHCIHTIIKCMKYHTPKQELLIYEEGVIAIYNIIQYKQNAIQLIQEEEEESDNNGGLAIIMDTMKVHKTRLTIQKSCLGILLRLIHVNNDYIISKAQQYKIFDICVSNLYLNNKHLQIQKAGCLLWKQVVSFTEKDDEYEMLLNANVSQQLIQTFKAHSNEIFIIHHILIIFNLMIQYETKKDKETKFNSTTSCCNVIIVLDNLSDIIKVIIKHPSNVDIQRESYKLLRTFQDSISNGNNIKLSKSLISNNDVRRIFQLAQINPKRLVPI